MKKKFEKVSNFVFKKYSGKLVEIQMNNFFNVILQNECNLNLYSNHKMSNNNNALKNFVYCSINMIRKEQIERQKILEKSFQSKNCQSLFDGIHFRPYCRCSQNGK